MIYPAYLLRRARAARVLAGEAYEWFLALRHGSTSSARSAVRVLSHSSNLYRYWSIGRFFFLNKVALHN